MDEESCATLLLLNTTSIRIVRFIVFGESSAATYYKSIHQFTRKETLCRKKILKKLLKFGLLFLLLLLELLFLNIPQ